MNDLFKRRGTFKVSRDLIESNPEGVIEALKDVLIVSLENDFMTNSLIYRGYSKHFDLLEDDELETKYNAVVSNNNDEITVTWVREKVYSERTVQAILEDINNGFKEADERIINRAAEVAIKKLQEENEKSRRASNE